ncbi:anaerobic sulfatase maturase [Dongia sp.]|uniref:anaerobic sulfatase maturase n=1 Tax=Dongia sp. TaxID=1977262 RepID=UPI0035B1D05B
MPTDNRNHAKSLHVTAKPVGSLCSLNCTYCYYAYADKPPAIGSAKSAIMSDATLEELIRGLVETSDTSEIHICWHGGEPLLAGMDFYERAVALQAQYCPPGRRFVNAFQTSGVGLDAEWARFLADNAFLVGLSIDGPKFLHDRCRHDRMGRSRFAASLSALHQLQRFGVPVNSLTTVGTHNFEHGARIYRFLKQLGFKFMQFIPVVERLNAKKRPAPPPGPAAKDEAMHPVADWSVPATGFGRFLNDVFDIWLRHDTGRVSVQNFDLLLRALLGAPSGLCVSARRCGDCLALEADGSLYACDHYVFPEYYLGKLGQETLGQLANRPSQHAFGEWKQESLPDDCLSCSFRQACHGGCPKHRFIPADRGHSRNYLCPSYKNFFAHAAPRMAERMTAPE